MPVRRRGLILLESASFQPASFAISQSALRASKLRSATGNCLLKHPTITTHAGHACQGGRPTRAFSRLSGRLTIAAASASSSIPAVTREAPAKVVSDRPFFQTGFSLFAKRPPRPFPKPWINPPTSSFSEPLSVHSTSLSRRPLNPHQHISPASNPENVGGRFLRGYTNGDDALLVHHRYMAVADGVGSWNLRDRGYPALWSRLMLHYFSIGCERFFNRSARQRAATDQQGDAGEPDIRKILNEAYKAVIKVTDFPTVNHPDNLIPKGEGTLPKSETQRYHGTTTFTGCILHGNKLHVITVGDSHCLVLRPSTNNISNEGDAACVQPKFLLRTQESWHDFDCPRQLGTDSPDTPLLNSTVSKIDMENGDVVIMASDGMLDNLWEEEVISIILRQLGVLVTSHGDELDGGDLGVMMKRRGQKRVEEGVNVAFRESVRVDHGARLKYGEGLREMEIDDDEDLEEGGELMTGIAAELVKAAKVVATDPDAESPWMERAINEGKSAQGGKLDDISVLVGRVVGLK